MNRFFLKIEYDGTNFRGWQKQKNQLTIQGCINQAIDKFSSENAEVVGAGRTDAGVHAKGQVAHLDLKKNWDENDLMKAINFYLKPNLISINSVAKVDNKLHARFSALERHYIFRIFIKKSPLALNKNFFLHLNREIDIKKITKASKYLIGTHDFTTFRSSICQSKSPIKTINDIRFNLQKKEDGEIIDVELKARSFLHNQVRSIIGSLIKVGIGNWEPCKIKKILLAKDRKVCGPVVSPHGLYLNKIIYPVEIFNC